MNEKRLLIFGGTTEGRELLERGVPSEENFCGETVLYSTATEEGAELIERDPLLLGKLKNIRLLSGRLDRSAIEKLIHTSRVTHVIDATHPYATDVTENIRTACEASGTALLRLGRKMSTLPNDAVAVDSPEEAAALLNGSDEKVLLATGSKSLPAFVNVKNSRERLFVRVLPISEVVAKCEQLGFDTRHIIAMQGPFSVEMNEQILRMTGAKTLVTKDGGVIGGMEEKLLAAERTGARVIVIRPPRARKTPAATSLEEALLWMRREMGFSAPPLFPMLLPIEGKIALVVGGGPIALRRAKTLERCGARVRVVARRFYPEWEKFFAEHEAERDQKISIEKNMREFRPEDLDDVILVVAATDDRSENARICENARVRNIPASNASAAAAGSFYFPSLIECDGAAASVSTAGISPEKTHALANIMREEWPKIVARANGEKP